MVLSGFGSIPDIRNEWFYNQYLILTPLLCIIFYCFTYLMRCLVEICLCVLRADMLLVIIKLFHNVEEKLN